VAAKTSENSVNRQSPKAGQGACPYSIYHGDALDVYESWPTPTTIISDGAYGVGGFPGDPRTPDSIGDWYRDHIEAWSSCVSPATTLWFWNTEIGWANVHPVLEANGWEYVQAIHWDKGIAHIAGNVNGGTIRRFPIVNEICVFYQRKLMMSSQDGPILAKQWLRREWERSGLPLKRANDACGVKDAATRKYFDQGWLWYFPPPEPMRQIVAYANEHGDPAGRPYYSLNGTEPVTAEEWDALRYKWNHEHGLTNVWEHPPVNGPERFRGTGKRHAPRVHNPKAGVASAHLNQKPIAFMERILNACTSPGHVVWEPFGGLCSAVVAAIALERNGVAAEPHDDFYELAVERCDLALRQHRGEGVLFK
jgi:hypothetical protein